MTDGKLSERSSADSGNSSLVPVHGEQHGSRKQRNIHSNSGLKWHAAYLLLQIMGVMMSPGGCMVALGIDSPLFVCRRRLFKRNQLGTRCPLISERWPAEQADEGMKASLFFPESDVWWWYYQAARTQQRCLERDYCEVLINCLSKGQLGRSQMISSCYCQHVSFILKRRSILRPKRKWGCITEHIWLQVRV